jgi:hypothetical protein
MGNGELRAKVAANIAEARKTIAILQDFVEDENLKAVLTATLADIAEYESAGARPRDAGEDDEREARRLQRALDEWPGVVVQLRTVEGAVSTVRPDASAAGENPEE